jgi:glycosyltransferase involved in cell wall biosynthesis
MRIHVFCSDLPPLPGKPASGGGLRSGNIIRFLRARGHTVSFSTRRTAITNKMTDIDLHEETKASQLALLQKNKAEAAYYCYALNCALDQATKQKAGLKIFFDIHGPTFLEEALWMCGGVEMYFRTFSRNLALADEVTVVAENQIAMVQTALAAVGALWNPPNIAVVPLEVDVEPLNREISSEPMLLFAGAIQPWQDPTGPMEVVARTLKKLGSGYLFLVGGPHNVAHPETVNMNCWLAKMEKTYPQFKWAPFVPREDLMRFYAKAWATVELFSPNIERQIAFTTRTWEQLALGLPILYGNSGVIAPMVAERQAGWVIDPHDTEQITRAVEEICSSRDEVVRRGANAPGVVEDYIATWSGRSRFRYL